jgi:hypothetical protein
MAKCLIAMIGIEQRNVSLMDPHVDMDPAFKEKPMFRGHLKRHVQRLFFG